MARGDTQYYDIDWDRFSEIVIEKWQEKLIEKKIYATGALYSSFEYNYRAVNSANQIVGRGSGGGMKSVPDYFAFSFPMYGIYVERGVGRGYTRGNGGDLVQFKERGRSRERRWWYYNIFVRERKRLGELVSQAYGRAAASQILTIETRSISRR